VCITTYEPDTTSNPNPNQNEWRQNEFESSEAHIFVVRSTSTISRFGERFLDGQYSLVSYLFAVLLLMMLPCPAICKSGGARAPSELWSRRH